MSIIRISMIRSRGQSPGLAFAATTSNAFPFFFVYSDLEEIFESIFFNAHLSIVALVAPFAGLRKFLDTNSFCNQLKADRLSNYMELTESNPL